MERSSNGDKWRDKSAHISTIKVSFITKIEGLRSKTGLKRFLVSGDIRALVNNCTVNLEYDVYTRLYEDTCVISACSR